MNYVLIILQANKKKGYWVRVPKHEFYDTRIGDKIPMSKDYGLITGREYKVNVFFDNQKISSASIYDGL